MPIPQHAIFALGTPAHLHLEFDVHEESSLESVLAALAAITSRVTTVAGVNLAIGFGAELWRRLAPDSVPADLVGFQPVDGTNGFTMPATQHDLWLWLHGGSEGSVFALGHQVVDDLASVASVGSECRSFVFGASQDLTGYEDGTENPPLSEAAAVVSMGEPCPGASIVLVQRWIHDLTRFGTLSPLEQDQVFGRTRHGSVELDEDTMSPGSHVDRVVIEDEAGEELEVFRRSTPWGGPGEHGLLFVGFSSDRDRLQTMLERMAGIGDGVRDLVTEFSTPVSGAWYLAPSVEMLGSLLPDA